MIGDRRRQLTAACQDVEDDVGGVDTLTESLEASRLDRGQAVAQHSGENVNYLPVSVPDTGELAADTLQTTRGHPVFGGRAVSEGPGLNSPLRNCAFSRTGLA